jgi:glycosyltransferase involved in cell wall biosynthesis
MEMTGLSVIVCTFNRSAQLGELLDSIARASPFLGEFEVVVVDNNCTDATATVVAGHALSPRLVQERQQGLSHARNRGVAVATHANLLFLDDDALVPVDYFARLAEVLEREIPDLFGGPVLPLFERPPPTWFPSELETRRYADAAGFSQTATLSGGNFGIRRGVLVRIGPFDTALGMSGSTMAFGEDRELVERYRRLTPRPRQRLYYDPALAISHRVGAEKLSKAYQLKRSFETARARERVFIGAGVRSAVWSRVLAAGRLALAPLTCAMTALRGGFSPRARFLAGAQLWGYAGRFAGAFGN